MKPDLHHMFRQYFESQGLCEGKHSKCDVKEYEYPWNGCEYYWACDLLWKYEKEINQNPCEVKQERND